MTQHAPLTSAKRALLLALCLVVLIGAFLGIYFLTRPQTAAGDKTITVSVAPLQGKASEHVLHTSREFLGDALLDKKLVSGEEGAYGLFITTAGGVTVTEGTQEWWCLTKGGETVMTGVSATPIADGDRFELTEKDSY